MNGYLRRKRNKTLLYILPQLNYYSNNISNRIRIENFYGCYIGYKELDENHIYLLYKELDEDTVAFVHWLSKKEYCVSKIKIDDIYTLLKMKLPIRFKDSIKHFIEGNYSKMYTKEDIDSYFIPIEYSYLRDLQNVLNDENNSIKSILKKDSTYERIFLNKVNKKFDTDITELNKESEYEFKPDLKDEILEYESDKI